MAHAVRDTYLPYREALGGDYSVRHKQTFSNEKSRFHIHDEFEVLLSLSSGMKLETADKTYILPHYSLLLFNSMDLHLLSLMSPDTENNRYVVYFRPEYINALSTERTDLLECFMLRPFADANVLPLEERAAMELAGALDRIIALQDAPEEADYGSDLQMKLLLADYLLRINRLYRAHHRIGNRKTVDGYRTVYAILTYLHQNYWDDVSLDQLARQFFINKYYMCTLFRQITGFSPRQYLINCRILKARELLLNAVPVEEVCGKVGYNNLSHFSRAFKDKVGMSPKKFQLHAQGNPRPALPPRQPPAD